MEYGFVGPLDIPTEAFPPDLQPVAKIIRDASSQGAKGFSEVGLHLIQSGATGESQDLFRAKIADIAEEVPHRPEALEGSAQIVREYDLLKRRQHLVWEMNEAGNRGEPIDDFLRRLAEMESGESRSDQPKSFDFVRADDITGTSEAMDFVEGLLTEGGASVIYGPSNCGKSFWIIDLGACVASGNRFRDALDVDQGAVVYIALEGLHGAKNRIAALKQTGRLKSGTPFFLIGGAVSLLETGHTSRLCETVSRISRESGVKVRLVILDTLARAMAGGDENSGVDMTAAVKSIDAIRAATGAHVAIVHHCGKDEARGARGHSSLRAAVDTEIEISRTIGATISTVRVTKQRDLQVREAMPFSLEVITLGTDQRGKPITSCIVRHENEMMASKPGKTGRKPTCTAEEMLQYLPADNIKAWQERVAEETDLGRSQFYDHKKQLESGKRFRKTSTGIQKT